MPFELLKKTCLKLQADRALKRIPDCNQLDPYRLSTSVDRTNHCYKNNVKIENNNKISDKVL